MLTTEVKTDTDIEAICLEFIKHFENHTGYNKQAERAKQNQDYYRGAIWTEDEYNAYKTKGIEPITINRCRPVIKALVGMYLDNLREPSVIARKNATESMARVWTETAKHALDLGGGDVALASLFFSGIKDTRSVLWVEKKQEGPGGKLTFAADGFFETTIDPDCDVYDISDPKRGAKYAYRTQFIDREICEMTYPDKKDQFAMGMVTMAGASGNASLFKYLTNGYTGVDEDRFYRYPVYIIWWRQSVRGIKLKNNKTGDTRIVTTKKVKMQDGYSWESVPTFKMHRSVMVGYTLAEDTVNPFGDDVTEYPAFKFVPLYEAGAEYGALDDITSLNKAVCVEWTEAQRLLKQTVNVGFKTGGGSIKDKKWLADNGSTNGIVIDESLFGGKVERLQPNTISSGDILLGNKADLAIDQVSQVNEDMRGQAAGKDERVGVVQQRLSQGIKSNQIILNNFWHTLELMGNFLLKVIRKTDIYTNDEIRMIVSKSNLIDKKTLMEAEAALVDDMGGARLPAPMQPQPPNPQLMAMAPPEQRADIYMQITDGIKSSNLYNQRYPRLRKVWDDVVKEKALNQIIEEMRDDDLAEYGLKVVVSPATASNKLLNWLKMQDLMEKNPMLAPLMTDIMVEDSGLPRADEIVQRLREGQQQRPQQLPPGAGQNPAQNPNANAGSKAALTKQIAMAG